jgi:hypothetical protein
MFKFERIGFSQEANHISMQASRTVITGTGSYIPEHIKTNQDFTSSELYGEDHLPLTTPANEISGEVRRDNWY